MLNEDLRLIDTNIVEQGVQLLNTFSYSLQQLGNSFQLSANETKELHDKIFKGNEATVANFVNNSELVKDQLSAIVGERVVGFNLSYNPHGTDGYIKTETSYIPVEIKTTTGKVVNKTPRQLRKSATDKNVQYTADFKFHFNDTNGTFEEEFDKELNSFSNNEICLFAGLYDVATGDDKGHRQVADLFVFTGDQIKAELINKRDNYSHNKKLLQFSPTTYMHTSSRHFNTHYVFSDENVK